MQPKHNAVTARSVTPGIDNAPWQGRVIGEQGQLSAHDFADDDRTSKALTLMRARAALTGCTLHEMADGGYVVARWNYSRAVPCLRAVGDLLRQIGGR